MKRMTLAEAFAEQYANNPHPWIHRSLQAAVFYERHIGALVLGRRYGRRADA